jgi:hypothetical protein
MNHFLCHSNVARQSKANCTNKGEQSSSKHAFPPMHFISNEAGMKGDCRILVDAASIPRLRKRQKHRGQGAHGRESRSRESSMPGENCPTAYFTPSAMNEKALVKESQPACLSDKNS